jgi:hypothetical protein
LILGDAVDVLDSARQPVALSCDRVDVIISKLAPSFSYMSLELLPIALNDIPIHCVPLLLTPLQQALANAWRRASAR